MTRRLLAVAALAVVAGWTAPAAADDQVIPLGRYQPTEGGFGAGVVTPGQFNPEATDGDTEKVWYHRYRNFYGYRPYYGFSYYRSPAYYGFYRPGFSYSYYAAPRFYYPPTYYSYSYPSYYYGYGYGYSYYPGWCGISLREKIDTAANVVDLAMRAKAALDASRAPEPAAAPYYPFPQTLPNDDSAVAPQQQPSAPQPGQPGQQFRYDGGPSNPVPMPTPDAKPQQPAPAPQPQQPAADDPGTVQISLPAKPVSKYRFAAYGEN